MRKKKVNTEEITAASRKRLLLGLTPEELDKVKVIEFMGYRLALCNNGMAWESPYPRAIDDHFRIHGMLLQSSLRKLNHLTLDTLKPVIDKIGTINVNFEPLANVSLYSPIDLIFKEIVGFIDYYNDEFIDWDNDEEE